MATGQGSPGWYSPGPTNFLVEEMDLTVPLIPQSTPPPYQSPYHSPYHMPQTPYPAAMNPFREGGETGPVLSSTVIEPHARAQLTEQARDRNPQVPTPYGSQNPQVQTPYVSQAYNQNPYVSQPYRQTPYVNPSYPPVPYMSPFWPHPTPYVQPQFPHNPLPYEPQPKPYGYYPTPAEQYPPQTPRQDCQVKRPTPMPQVQPRPSVPPFYDPPSELLATPPRPSRERRTARFQASPALSPQSYPRNVPPRVPTESIPKYNGKFEFDNFKVQFECLAEEFGWTYREKGKKLIRCLVDEARSVLGTMSVVEATDYNALCKALDGLHNEPGGKALVQAKLQRVVRTPGQSAASFGREIKRMGRKAYPGGNDEALAASFIRGLNDEDMRKYVQLQMPSSLDEAIEFASIYQTVEGEVSGAKKPIVMAAREERVGEAPGVVTQPDWAQQLAEVKTQLDKVMAKLAEKQAAPRTTPRIPLSEIECFQCRQKGHYANKCPQGRGQPSGVRSVNDRGAPSYPELNNYLNC